MRIFILFILFFVSSFLLFCKEKVPSRAQATINSPDGQLTVNFYLNPQAPQYEIRYKDKVVLNPSSLGFRFKDAPALQANMKIERTEVLEEDTSWTPVWGTDHRVRDHYRQMIIHLKERNNPHRLLDLVFRAYNDGVAFRYILPAQREMHKVEIISEETRFRFAHNDTAWWIPADYDSYEHLYSKTALSDIKGVNTPFTIQTKEGYVITVHEAALTDYPAMTLKRLKDRQTDFKSELVPWPDSIKVKHSIPLQTPWRVLIIVSRAKQLLASHLIENLNKPNKIKDTSWIRPMKYVGIWWGMHIGKYTWHSGTKHGATTRRAKQYIDFAATHHIQGVLIEGWNRGWDSWLSGNNVQSYTTPYPDFNLKEVARYARQKGISLIGHQESGGNVPQYERQLTAALDLYQSLGIHAVKTGYAGKMHPSGQHHHGQWMVRHYRRVVQEAAKRQIMIDAHEPIKPTGIRRTWPNMMTREGVRGMEYNAWSDGNPPEHTTILPFTRMVAGPLDYTPGIFNIKFDPSGKHRVYTTLAKQLALYVVLFSPLQMAADLIENYRHQPAFRFIEEVPTNWDETLPLQAKIGDYVSVARRKGNDWFIGTITDEHPRQMQIALGFLTPNRTYEADIYEDSPQTDYDTNPTAIRIRHRRVSSNDTLRVKMTRSGGQAVHLKWSGK